MPNERCPNRLRCIDRNTSTEKRKDKETIIIISICSQTTNMSSTATFATFAKQVMTSSCSKLLLFKLLFWRKISLRMINRNFVSASSASIRGRPLLDPVSHSMGPDKGYRPPSYGLSARPSVDTPVSAASQSQQQGFPQPQRYMPPIQQGFYPGYGYGYQPNVSGGYPSGGFYPMYAAPAPSFGQSLFRPPVAANPEGYSYSTTYLSSQYNQQASTPDPPTKRQRPNNSNVMTGGSAKPWRNCSHPGCKFVGPGDQVEIHEEDRHLIYAPGKAPERSEEEERFAKRKGYVRVLGVIAYYMLTGNWTGPYPLYRGQI